MSAIRRLLAKDLLLLRRTPVLLALLIGYPVLVALLVTAALRGGDDRPTIAVVNLDASGRLVSAGGRQLDVDGYIDRLAENVTVRRLDAERAKDALEGGRVAAVVTIPDRFMASLQSGLRPPTVVLETSRRTPLEAEQVERRLESALYRVNQELSTTYVELISTLFVRIGSGGELCLFGRCGTLVGLVRASEILGEVRGSVSGPRAAAQREALDDLITFIDGTKQNLDLVLPAANAIKSPIQLSVVSGPKGRQPVSAFGLAGALLVSLGLIGVLLAAAMFSIERESNALVRLGRGLVPPWALVVAKILFAAVACVVVGLIVLAGIELLTDVAIGRWLYWVGALIVAGIAFAAFGVLTGALAKETRTALLAGLMVALPLLFLGLVPGNAIASGISSVTPFGPAFEAFQTLLIEPRVPGRLAGDLLHLLGLGLALALAAGVVLRRRLRG